MCGNVYVQFKMHNDITSISYGHLFPPPHTHPNVHPAFFGADGADAGKPQPKVDANGNCGAGEQVSLLCFCLLLVPSVSDDAKLIFLYADSR